MPKKKDLVRKLESKLRHLGNTGALELQDQRKALSTLKEIDNALLRKNSSKVKKNIVTLCNKLFSIVEDMNNDR